MYIVDNKSKIEVFGFNKVKKSVRNADHHSTLCHSLEEVKVHNYRFYKYRHAHYFPVGCCCEPEVVLCPTKLYYFS